MTNHPTRLLRDMFDAAIASAQAELRIPQFLPSQPKGRLIVIGAGKASAAMAQAVEQHWSGPLEGLVVTRYGYAAPCESIEIVEAAHPVPDQAGLDAARRMLNLVGDLCEDDTVLCLMSGGASSLLPLPLRGLGLADKQAVNQALLRSGASISEMNCVRRHLSAIKGGRLAAACHPAKVVNLLISDVPGDNPGDIGSGPTVGDASTRADALKIIERYRLDIPEAARQLLERAESESIKPDDARLKRVETHFIATPQQALDAAAEVAAGANIPTWILGDSIEGEAREVAKVLAGIAQQVVRHQQPFTAPCVLLSGGETTVTLNRHADGSGRGGRNVEFLLALAIALNGVADVYALAGDTDGVDGSDDIAGAIITPDSLDRARKAGLDARQALSNNDAHGFFEALGDSIITGPTKTNVNDFRAILILPRD